MGKVNVYNFVSANGYFKGQNEDISWAYQNASQEESDFAAENAQGGAILLFGRRTYQMMASYWPTPAAKKNNAGVAEGMNKAQKIVFSKTLKQAEWDNTKIVSGDIVDEVRKLKQSEKHMTILGSGTITNQMAEAGLIDEIQLMIHPVAIGSGTPFLKDIHGKIDLELMKTRVFKNGMVMLSYQLRQQ
jgi:dihydrofolate reductase